MQDNHMERAVELVKSGRVDDARNMLENIIKEDRKNIAAWRMYAETWQKASDKVRVWEYCLRYNPSSQEAEQALAELKPDRLAKMSAQKKTASNDIGMAAPVKSGFAQWLVWGGLGIFVIIAIIGVITVKNALPKDPEEYKHTQPVEYYLYVPKNYSPEKNWTLFVGIHGAGSSGLECWNLWQSFADKEGFILVCPTIPGDGGGYYQDVGESTVWSAISAVKKEYKVKPKIFFSGFSAGAFFIQGFTYHYPQSVNALSILSAGLYFNPREFPVYVPMLVVIGDQDNGTAIQSSKLFVDELKKLGFDVQYEVIPGMGHTVNKKGMNLTIELFRNTMQE